MDDLLQQGITAHKAGKRDEARKLFITAVKQNPDNERAWGGMYEVSNDDKERIYCLKQMLRINPKNEKTNQMLNKLTDFNVPLNQPETQNTKFVNTDQPIINKQQQKPEDLKHTDRRITSMTSWEYCEVVLMTPGLQAQGLFFLGLAKGSAAFGIYGAAKEEKIELSQLGQYIANLGQNGWELVVVTEAVQPNTWLKTRWVFKRPK